MKKNLIYACFTLLYISHFGKMWNELICNGFQCKRSKVSLSAKRSNCLIYVFRGYYELFWTIFMLFQLLFMQNLLENSWVICVNIEITMETESTRTNVPIVPCEWISICLIFGSVCYPKSLNMAKQCAYCSNSYFATNIHQL